MRRHSSYKGMLALGTGVLMAMISSPATPAIAAAGGWSEVPVPDQNVGSSYLTSVDGRTDSDAWTVGFISPSAAGEHSRPLALRWNGSTWATTALPQQGVGSTLWGVSASRANDAWAVGNFLTHASGYGFVDNPSALHWNGSAWTATAVPGTGTVYGVAAVSPTDAWAVGTGLRHWDGNAWSAVVTPSPNPALADLERLDAVTARTAGDVWAVGSYLPTRFARRTGFALHFDGVSWRLVPVPTGISLSSIASAGQNDVWATGSQLDRTTGITQPMLLRWNGTVWSSTPDPLAGGSVGSVTARAANDVWATGTASADGSRPVVLHWNGAAWSAQPLPNTIDTPSVYALSARPGTTRTWAVGTRYSGVPLVLERH